MVSIDRLVWRKFLSAAYASNGDSGEGAAQRAAGQRWIRGFGGGPAGHDVSPGVTHFLVSPTCFPRDPGQLAQAGSGPSTLSLV